jgi:glycosyltransferase involved in cell wall biosynthesis
MRILHLIDSAGIYGAEKMLLALCVEQRRLGADASVLSACLPQETERAIDAELRKLAVPVVSWPMRAGLNLRAMREICAWAVNHHVDVLHSHGYKFNVLLALTPCNIRKVTTVHGYTWSGLFSWIAIYNTLDRLSHFAFDRVVYVSPALLRRSLVRATRRSSIPNGIDMRSFPVTEGLRQPAADRSATRLLAVGRLAAEKDYELLLRAVALLRMRGMTVSLDIFGEGPEESKLRRVIEEEGLDQVALRGYSNQIPAELGLHDILVLSSKTEGMPITIIEAMCLGVRIVATRVGGVPSLLESYPLATLANTRSAADLADAIEAQMVDSQSLDAEELVRVRAQFSSATMACRYVRLYEGILGSPGTAASG